MNENFTTENNGDFIEVTADGRAKSSVLAHFEQFRHDRGWEFKTDEDLKAGYARLLKCERGLLLTKDEFIIEAGKPYEAQILGLVYNALAELVAQKKLGADEVYRYARFKWCLGEPEAIIAYEENWNRWLVNNCGTEVSEDTAVVAVNIEWGFEASRIKIIGKPYYEATDYQFIRFDCAHMTWLWKNGNLYQVYS